MVQEGVISPSRGSNETSASTLDGLCRVHRSCGGTFAQEPAFPVGNWQSVTNETYTSPLHPVLTGAELYLKIDVSNDGSFRGEWREYSCFGSVGEFGTPTSRVALTGKASAFPADSARVVRVSSTWGGWAAALSVGLRPLSTNWRSSCRRTGTATRFSIGRA